MRLVVSMSLLVTLSLPVAACGQTAGQGESASGQTAGDSAPRVHESYQEDIDEAWELAVKGEDPSRKCRSLSAGVVGRYKYMREKIEEEAPSALAACVFDIPVRYLRARLESVEKGERTCQEYFSENPMAVITMTTLVDPGPAILGDELTSSERADRVHAAVEDQLAATCPR